MSFLDAANHLVTEGMERRIEEGWSFSWEEIEEKTGLSLANLPEKQEQLALSIRQNKGVESVYLDKEKLAIHYLT